MMTEDEWVATQVANAPDFSDETWRQFAQHFGFRDASRIAPDDLDLARIKGVGDSPVNPMDLDGEDDS